MRGWGYEDIDKLFTGSRERAVRTVREHRGEHESQNALVETINGLYKAEVVHRQPWKSREAVEFATLAWVDWFNHRRLLAPISNILPAEAEEVYYRQLNEFAIAA